MEHRTRGVTSSLLAFVSPRSSAFTLFSVQIVSETQINCRYLHDPRLLCTVFLTCVYILTNPVDKVDTSFGSRF
jgi:hypothetical protein